MRSMRQLLAATLMVSMIAATGGMTVSAATPQTKGISVQNADDQSDSTDEAKKTMEQYKKIEGIDSDKTILGADFTHYQQNIGWGKVWKDYKGIEVDNLFDYVKTQGINTISVKIAVNPSGDDEYLSLDNAKKTLKEAKSAGLKTNAVLLYSDEMTYGNTQNLPSGWTADDAGEKAIAYTKETLKDLEENDALPDIVTVGNEVNYNFLGISGNDGFVQIGKITKEIKDTYTSMKTAVSISMPSEPEGIKWVQEQLNGDWNNISYDYLGVNVYPDDNTNDTIKTLREEFEKNQESATVNQDAQLIVSNVKYPWKDEDDKASIATQADNIYQLLSATIDEKNTGGIIYDHAESVGDWYSFFNDSGQAMYSLAIFAYAQGNRVDVSSYKDPWEYGENTGLRDQKVDIQKISGMAENTIRGVDISSYQALKNAGVKFYDYDGQEASLLKVLHESGVNYVRLRVWNDPYNENHETYGGGSNDVETSLKIAKEASKYGMKVLLCFQYSDFWADPAVQLVPKTWQKDQNDPEKMKQNIYDFTKETLEKFKAEGVNVGMVQVGNEITSGMAGIMPDTSKNESYKDTWGNEEKAKILCGYLNAGIKAVRECTPDALTTLHLETLDYGKCATIMDAWEKNHVDYDIYGTSFYQFWQGSSKENALEKLKAIQNRAKSKGKMFVVLETSWMNCLKDGDGTPNVIGEDAENTNVYTTDAQGQVDALSDMYRTVLSDDSGLGAFYWEPAWIPVKAGWRNWEYNKEIANKYGTGWASKGAVGYFTNDKLYYNGQPAWGGTSWDNQTLFDINGYPLQSLNFYKDSVSEGTQQVTAVKICDEKGNQIYATQYVKVEKGKTKTISLPKISGYVPKNKSYELKIEGTSDGMVTTSVSYKKLPQGAAIKYNYRVKIKTKKYKVYKDFNWKKTKINPYNKVYVAKYQYKHQNGSTYLELYTKGGKFVGYINKKAAKRLGYATDPEQGKAYKYGKRVKITKKSYKLYKNFKWQKSKTKVYKKTYTAKYRYNHENGHKYLALYTKSGKFVGYINAKAAKVVK